MTVIGLGSNVGDRLGYLRSAIQAIVDGPTPLLSNVHYSKIYESQALLKDGAPSEWDRPFLNMAIQGKSSLDPLSLLSELQAIEKRLGRQDRGEWAPREIDLDILAWESIQLSLPDLVIPHPRMHERAFQFVPLIDVCPNWTYPGEDQPISSWLLSKKPLVKSIRYVDICLFEEEVYA